MESNSKKIIIYFFLGLVVVAEVGLLLWFLPGIIGDVTRNVAKIAQLSLAVKDNQDALAVLAKTDDKLLGERMAKARASLPDGKEPSALISGMTTLASSSGVVVKEMSFSPGLVSSSAGNLTTGVQVMPVSLVVTGQFSQLVVFLRNLAVAQQLMGVDRVDYGQVSGTPDLGANIGLALYYLPAKDNITVTDVRPLSDAQAKLLDGLKSENIFILPGGSH